MISPQFQWPYQPDPSSAESTALTTCTGTAQAFRGMQQALVGDSPTKPPVSLAKARSTTADTSLDCATASSAVNLLQDVLRSSRAVLAGCRLCTDLPRWLCCTECAPWPVAMHFCRISESPMVSPYGLDLCYDEGYGTDAAAGATPAIFYATVSSLF